MSTNFLGIYTSWLEKQAVVASVMKAARCWAGYEPVPGKAPYSEDSCRPKGSKKKDAKKEKKAESQLGDALREGVAPSVTHLLPAGTAAGAILGALHGATGGAGALRGALRGGMMGAGATTGAPLGGVVGAIGSKDIGLNDTTAFSNGIVGTVGGGLGGALLAGTAYDKIEEALRGKKKDAKKEKKAEEASSGASHFKHTEKEPEAVVNGQKPSTENTKHQRVTPKTPSEGENLHPAASLLKPDGKSKAD